MAFAKIKGALYRAFKRGHPDIYKVLKRYCDNHGLNISDVTAAAVASYMAADEEGRVELEAGMKARRIGGGGSGGSVKASLGVFKDVCGAMGEMFEAMNKARSGMSMSAMLSDFEAVSTTISKMKEKGSEAGKGSVEDALATAILSRILGGIEATKTKTGTGKIKKIK